MYTIGLPRLRQPLFSPGGPSSYSFLYFLALFFVMSYN